MLPIYFSYFPHISYFLSILMQISVNLPSRIARTTLNLHPYIFHTFVKFFLNFSQNSVKTVFKLSLYFSTICLKIVVVSFTSIKPVVVKSLSVTKMKFYNRRKNVSLPLL